MTAMIRPRRWDFEEFCDFAIDVGIETPLYRLEDMRKQFLKADSAASKGGAVAGAEPNQELTLQSGSTRLSVCPSGARTQNSAS